MNRPSGNGLAGRSGKRTIRRYALQYRERAVTNPCKGRAAVNRQISDRASAAR